MGDEGVRSNNTHKGEGSGVVMHIRERREEYQRARGRGARSINTHEGEEQQCVRGRDVRSNNGHEDETRGATMCTRARREEQQWT